MPWKLYCIPSALVGDILPGPKGDRPLWTRASLPPAVPRQTAPRPAPIVTTTATASTTPATDWIDFQTDPSQYRHWSLEVDGDIAHLKMAVEPFGGLKGDAYSEAQQLRPLGGHRAQRRIQRLRFERGPLRGRDRARDRVFCAGANIVMLRSSAHAFKVNFCKYTNETRLGIEDASANSNKRFVAALNGTASGGGYELALACDRILLVDDRNSAVSFPEVPLLGVLPGTGGLTRITDKRQVRRDRCDVFSSIAEGIKGKRAVEWDLVDRVAPLSKWDEVVTEEARAAAEECTDRAGAAGIALEPVVASVEERTWRYEYVTMEVNDADRTATLTINAPDACPTTPPTPSRKAPTGGP